MPTQSLEQLPFELWQRKIDVEVTGSFLLCKKVIPGMVQQQWGRVINFTGLAAFRGSGPLVSTTELGIVGLTRGIAREYGKYNITANCVGPGGVAGEEGAGEHLDPPADRDALPRWGKPTEVAFLAVCLASEDAGMSPGSVFWLMAASTFSDSGWSPTACMRTPGITPPLCPAPGGEHGTAPLSKQ